MSGMSCTTKFIPLNANARKLVHFRCLRISPYDFGTQLQRHFLNLHLDFKKAMKSPKAVNKELPPLMFTFEFADVYTGGKREKNVTKATPRLDLKIPFVQTDRGGQITYHGPGQLVSYFVWDLSNWSHLNSRCFVKMLENSCMETVQRIGAIDACLTEDTGVWVNLNKLDRYEKISSLGLNMKRNVSSHGISINVSPNLDYLNNPNLVICGLEGKKQTSISKITGQSPTISSVSNILSNTISKRMSNYMNETMDVYSYDIKPKDLDTTICEMKSLINTTL